MSLTFDDPSPVIGWPATRRPTRPGFWARLRERVFGPDPTGATSGWLTQMRTGDSRLDGSDLDGRHYDGRHYADNIATTLLRRPIAAIAATGHYAVYDEHLGGLNPDPDQATPFHDAIARWAAAGYPIDDQTTDTTGEKDQ